MIFYELFLLLFDSCNSFLLFYFILKLCLVITALSRKHLCESDKVAVISLWFINQWGFTLLSDLDLSLESVKLSAAAAHQCVVFYFGLLWFGNTAWRARRSCWYLRCKGGWTSGGFYKNTSLTDNLIASFLRRPRVPLGEGAFLFQPHTESPESQGWSLWVLIAFFPLFCQSAYSGDGKKGMKALQTLMKRSTNRFFFVGSPAGRMSCGGGRGDGAALRLIGWL